MVSDIDGLCQENELEKVREWLRTEQSFPIPFVSFETSLKIASMRSGNVDLNVNGISKLDIETFISDPPRKCITEVYGADSTGKSQILLMMAAANNSLYIGTEDRFRFERLKKFEGKSDVLVKIVYCVYEFWQIICNLRDDICSNNSRVILIDSFNLVKDPTLCNELLGRLKTYAIKFNISVIFTNQVRASMDVVEKIFQLTSLQSATPAIADEYIDHKLCIYRLDTFPKPLGYNGVDAKRVICVTESRSCPTINDEFTDLENHDKRMEFLRSRCWKLDIQETNVKITPVSDFE
eukprot:NODE_168_length_14557_cov_0.729008.p7 type:complete len:294 gc:universal NODE_168_length_14557_cov_0.729008:6260-7141(+)